jgi:glyceraldehyde 3-phosphate dehydrogenase
MISAQSQDLIKKYFPQAFYLNKKAAVPVVTQTPASATIPNIAQTAKPSFGINGFGRIGRTATRVWWQFYQDQADLKVINTSGSMDLEDWAHLLKYDTNYGVFPFEISTQPHLSKKEVTDDDPVLGTIILKDLASNKQASIIVTAQRDPAKIPWGKFGVQTVVESTGAFVKKEKAEAHLLSGAQKVIISAPPKGGGVSTSVIGVNEFTAGEKIVSNASCTTNCIAPVVKIMADNFGITKAFLTTIHSYTDDQNLQDNSHKDLRRARSAAENIVPTSTGAAISVTEIIPEVKGVFDGLAVRVPTPVGSLSDMVFLLKRKTSIEEINEVFKKAAASTRWQGILAVTEEPIVSSDIIGRRESSIVDLSLTNVIDGDFVKIIAWYDNEWGYCCRLIEQLSKLK